MPRIARAVLRGVPYHVTHRGNRRTATFLDDRERQRYLELFLEKRAEHGLRVWAYCLMPNHVHWILVPDRANSLAVGIRYVHGRYAAWLNHRHGWNGHLWANRFFSTALDDRYLWFAARYVELNPVRARLVNNPLDYRWSSVRANALGEVNRLMDPERPFARHPDDWKSWLGQSTEATEAADEAIRRNTLTGRPSGSASFIRTMETELGRTLTARPRGRRGGTPVPSAFLPGLRTTGTE